MLPPRHVPFLRARLEGLLRTYDASFLGSDPLGMVHAYRRDEDREVAAFFAASLAFGKAAAIRGSLARILGRLGDHPAGRLRGFEFHRDARLFDGLCHRWAGPSSLAALAHLTGAALREAGSLGALFMEGYDPAAPTLTGALAAFRRRLIELGASLPKKVLGETGYLLPDPEGTSACKRLHLFLRWMVRPSDGLDLGLWKGPRPDQLLIPLDTHLARIGRLLGLTDRRTPGRRMAEEVTASLRLLDPADPVRYDFALSRLGILGHCPSRR
ncbi:MAG: TIGR02757 family protein, partial [Nitrospinota bacterium]